MKKLTYLIFLALAISSCALTDTDQPVPAFFQVDSVSIATSANQGAPTHKITDLWVYADNQLLGVFPLPCKVPVITTQDTTEFLIFPGIRNSGQQSRAFIYNLLNQERFSVPLAGGEVIEKTFEFTYKDDAIFDFVEGFESPIHIFTNDVDEDPETAIVLSTQEAASGNSSGKIHLTAEHPTLTVASIFTYSGADNQGRDSYLEIEYKMDFPLLIGVSYSQDGQSFAQPVIQLNPSDDWNKTYVDFTQVLSSPAITSYNIFFNSTLDGSDVQEANIYLDNLKFVHF